MAEPLRPGAIAWQDLTVDDAEAVKGFYEAVVGWRGEPVDMGGYSDFNMMPSDEGAPTAGICHARGSNADLPPQWLLYAVVESLDRSLAACAEGGGAVVSGPREMGGARMAVIQDPAGAVLALYQPAGD